MGRLLHPVPIIVDQAILVAVVGLAVNGASVFILRVDDHHDHDDSHHAHHHDHNLKAAYLHVLADALTSLLAIVALLCAKYLGFMWMDPAVGIIGAILVSSWSLGLLRTTSGILLDKQGPKSIRDRIRNSIEQDDDSQVTDLHLWSIGPNIYSVVIAIVAHDPCLLYTSPSPRDRTRSRMPSSA